MQIGMFFFERMVWAFLVSQFLLYVLLRVTPIRVSWQTI